MSGEAREAPAARVCAPDLELAEPLGGNYFVSTYPPFSCWTSADARHASARPWHRRLSCPRAHAARVPLGLYVHIPFCADRCHYCYYLSHDDRLDAMDRYLQALETELAFYARTPVVSGRDLDFVYFGGGTPSLLSTSRVERLLSGLQEILPWEAAREVTFECAPRSVTPEKLATLRDWGVTRVSLGVQQMDDAVLRANGRVHLVADVEAAYAAMRRVGFPVVNVDLIVGLVEETDETFDAGLARVIELAPDSVTLYQLEIPLNTPLWRALRDGELAVEPPAWETKRARLRRAFDALDAAGYTRATAYAAVRDPERHRFLYQREQYLGADLLGIGTSAFSHLGGVNQQNLPALDDYLERVERGELPLFRLHASSVEELLVRELVLQLKLGRVERARLVDRFAVDVGERFAEPLRALTARGWLTVDDEAITVTPEGLARVDRWLESFYLPEHRGIRYS